MGDDAELYIETGGDPTILLDWYGLDDEWYDDDNEYDDYFDYEDIYDDLNNKRVSKPAVNRKKNTMVFIDAESISAERCPGIIGQCKSVGELFEVRYYARQKDPSTLAWKEKANSYGIKPILMYGEAEHNKIDNKIIKDIRKILANNKSIDIFCIATKDGDYSSIVKEIRENKKRAVIFATKDTSKKLKQAASEVKGV